MDLPKLPSNLSLEKLLLAGTGKLRDKRYERAVQALRKWCGDDPFRRGPRGFSEEIIRRIGEELINETLRTMEERNLGLNPVILREALKMRGINANSGFSELLFKCLKQIGACIEVRAVFPSSSNESKLLTFLKLKGDAKYLDIYKKFGSSENALLNLLKQGAVEISYRGKSLKLNGVERFEGLSEEEIKGIPEVFVTRVEEFDGKFSYRISIPLSAKVSLRWK